LTGTVETVSPWPLAYNFAEINGAVVGPTAREEGPLFNGDGLIAISDLNQNDVTVYVGPAAPEDGSFTVMLPSGDYTIAWFDIAQLYIIQVKTFSIPAGETSFNIGQLFLTGWYTEVQGFFFIDEDDNGVKGPTELGLSDGPFPVLRLRDGTQIDRGFQFEVPFKDPVREGFYNFRNAYPLSSWLTLHFFHPLWEVTGYTYRTEQQEPPTATTTVTAKNDEYHISIFGTPGVTTYLDVGFRRKPSAPPRSTGSIYGTVHYDSTRANMDADQAVVENHEPGIPGVTVKLYPLSTPQATNGNGMVKCNSDCVIDPIGFGYICGDEDKTMTDPKTKELLTCSRFWVGAEGESKPHPVVFWTTATGQLDYDLKGEKTVTTSEFQPPKDCKITDKDGNVIPFGPGQSVLPDRAGVTCVETPLLRNQVGGFSETDGSFKFPDLAPGYVHRSLEIVPQKRSVLKLTYFLVYHVAQLLCHAY